MSRDEAIALASRIRACRACEGLNEPGVTESAPGYGSITSPIMIVGQSLCGPCMKTQIPFTGGSGRLIDAALEKAGRTKNELFITNTVHCHPPNNRPSLPSEIENCRPFLTAELNLVSPRVVVTLGKDAAAAVALAAPAHTQGLWPLAPTSRVRIPLNPLVLNAPHPSWVLRQPRSKREEFITSLAAVISDTFARTDRIEHGS